MDFSLLMECRTDGKEYGSHYTPGTPAYEAETMKRWTHRIGALPFGRE